MPELGEALYEQVSFGCASLLTRSYSTSFGISISLLEPEIRPHIYAVYGMVRLADEIVDTFTRDGRVRLAHFKQEMEVALATKFSSNPILHAFQITYHTYGLPPEPIEAFFASMEMDLEPKPLTPAEFDTYVYGSAECVGLLCLSIFLRGDRTHLSELELPARRLGAGYQKVNFLRDIRDDLDARGRTYFPGVIPGKLTDTQKKGIEADIREDFAVARLALLSLPPDASRSVGLSIRYYEALLNQISVTSASQLLGRRIRVSNMQKALLFLAARLGLAK